MTAALAFRDLTLGYGRTPAVHNLTGTVASGDLLALIGPNGAGKSTLLKGIVGLAARLDGTIDLCGRTVSDIGYLPQRAEIDATFPLDVRDFVSMGSWRRLGAWRRVGARERARVETAIGQVGLSGFEARPIGTLSGGQLQRALFARTIVQDAALILLDEPFTAVDEGTTRDLVAVVAGWRDEGRTVIAALHDFGLVRECFPLALLLAREPIAWGPTQEVLTDGHLARSRRMGEVSGDGAASCAVSMARIPDAPARSARPRRSA